MIKNLSEYFKPEKEIFLDTINYKRIENLNRNIKGEVALLCEDNIKATANDKGVRIIVTRSLTFDPKELFSLTVSFGPDLKFNERKTEYDWFDVNLAEEFRENGDFITIQLMNRITLLIGEITSSFGQQPFILPPNLAKKQKK